MQLPTELLPRIRAILKASHRCHGAPRIHAGLRGQGILVARKTVAKLMKENDIRLPRKGRRVPRTTDSRYHLGIAPNLLRRTFKAAKPNRNWLADISVSNGCSKQWRKLGDCPLTGAGSTWRRSRSSSSSRRRQRRSDRWRSRWQLRDRWRTPPWKSSPLPAIAGNRLPGSGSMSGRLKSGLAVDAMRMALQNRRPTPGLICRSDRGVQCASGFPMPGRRLPR
ncbi:IS3 family transposase [Mangrovicoccus ximenensis]|uniref:IS3 family transposase n=1 Tax=Mangrovicoccus ximenensis TaxID=1911570 RepID=UPI001375109D